MAAVVSFSVRSRQPRRNPQETDSVQSIVGPRSAIRERGGKALRGRWLSECSLVQTVQFASQDLGDAAAFAGWMKPHRSGPADQRLSSSWVEAVMQGFSRV
jgi:hypothetical protein